MFFLAVADILSTIVLVLLLAVVVFVGLIPVLIFISRRKWTKVDDFRVRRFIRNHHALTDKAVLAADAVPILRRRQAAGEFADLPDRPETVKQAHGARGWRRMYAAVEHATGRKAYRNTTCERVHDGWHVVQGSPRDVQDEFDIRRVDTNWEVRCRYGELAIPIDPNTGEAEAGPYFTVELRAPLATWLTKAWLKGPS